MWREINKQTYKSTKPTVSLLLALPFMFLRLVKRRYLPPSQIIGQLKSFLVTGKSRGFVHGKYKLTFSRLATNGVIIKSSLIIKFLFVK